MFSTIWVFSPDPCKCYNYNNDAPTFIPDGCIDAALGTIGYAAIVLVSNYSILKKYSMSTISSSISKKIGISS